MPHRKTERNKEINLCDFLRVRRHYILPQYSCVASNFSETRTVSSLGDKVFVFLSQKLGGGMGWAASYSEGHCNVSRLIWGNVPS